MLSEIYWSVLVKFLFLENNINVIIMFIISYYNCGFD